MRRRDRMAEKAGDLTIGMARLALFIWANIKGLLTGKRQGDNT